MILATGSRRKALEIAETWKQYSGRKFFGFFPVDSYQLPVLSDRNRPETIKTINRFTSYIYEEENDGLAVYLDEPASFLNGLFIHELKQLLLDLNIDNLQPQHNSNQQWSIAEYSYLTEINLAYAHKDYVEQFLIDTKMCLLDNVCLHVHYDSLQTVTDNFTRDTTRVNCSKIKRLFLHHKPRIYFEDLKDYFSYAKVECLLLFII
jgi:hypothetical protein